MFCPIASVRTKFSQQFYVFTGCAFPFTGIKNVNLFLMLANILNASAYHVAFFAFFFKVAPIIAIFIPTVFFIKFGFGQILITYSASYHFVLSCKARKFYQPFDEYYNIRLIY